MSSFVEEVARTRRQDSRDEATLEAEHRKLTERQRHEARRSQNRALWIEHYLDLAEALALRSAEFQRKANALIEGAEK